MKNERTMKKVVAIQGIAGSYHDIAARKFFEGEELEIMPCSTFRDVILTIRENPYVFGLIAVESAVSGNILQNQNLVRESGLTVIGEYKLHITHSLVALPGTRIEDIKEVNSHPIALMQCSDFLERLSDVKLVEKDDTAGSAREIADKKKSGHAAVCGKWAAQIYGLDILAEGIESDKRNFMRFLVIADRLIAGDLKNTGIKNKSSLVFTLEHTTGSLSKVLSVLSYYDMNLTKIQSAPVLGREWEYMFYVNMTFKDFARYMQVIDAIRPLTIDLRVLGEYSEAGYD